MSEDIHFRREKKSKNNRDMENLVMLDGITTLVNKEKLKRFK